MVAVVIFVMYFMTRTPSESYRPNIFPTQQATIVELQKQRMRRIKQFSDDLIRHIQDNPDGSLNPIDMSAWYSGKEMKDVLQAIKTAFPAKTVYPMEAYVFQRARVRMENAIYVLWQWKNTGGLKKRIVTSVIGVPQGFANAVIPKALYGMTADEASIQLRLMNPGFEIVTVKEDEIEEDDDVFDPKRIRIIVDDDGDIIRIGQE